MDSIAMAKRAQTKLKKLRKEIDAVDQILMKALAKRFRIVREVGRLKLKHALPIVQKSRMIEMLNGRRTQALKLNLDGRLVYDIFDLIHDASIICQEGLAKDVPGKAKEKSGKKVKSKSSKSQKEKR